MLCLLMCACVFMYDRYIYIYTRVFISLIGLLEIKFIFIQSELERSDKDKCLIQCKNIRSIMRGKTNLTTLRFIYINK